MSKYVLDTFSLENVNTFVSLQTKLSVDSLLAMEGYFDKVMDAEKLIEIIDWVLANK